MESDVVYKRKKKSGNYSRSSDIYIPKRMYKHNKKYDDANKMAYIEQGTKEYKRASFALFLAGFVIFATLYSTQPLMPIFSEEFLVSASASSLTLSLTTGALAIALLFAASLSDGIGRKRIMVLSLLFTSALGLLTAFSPSFILLAILRGVLGVFLAGVPAIAMTYIWEEFDSKGLGKIMGLYISGTTVGGMTGRILTGIFTDLFTWRIALGIMGILSIVISILFWVILPTQRHFTKKPIDWKTTLKGYRSQINNKKLRVFILLPFLLMGSFVILFNYIGFLLIGSPYNLSQTFIGFMFIVYIAGTFSAVFMGKKADQYGRPFILKLSMAIMIGGALLTLIQNVIVILIGLSIFTFGFFGSHSVISAWVGDIAGNHKAQASSLYLLFYYLGSSLIGSLGGYFWTQFGWIGVVSLIVFLSLLSLLLVFCSREIKKVY
jgi:MFS transporter, YNFM family, putative membrane transport protein